MRLGYYVGYWSAGPLWGTGRELPGGAQDRLQRRRVSAGGGTFEDRRLALQRCPRARQDGDPQHQAPAAQPPVAMGEAAAGHRCPPPPLRVLLLQRGAAAVRPAGRCAARGRYPASVTPIRRPMPNRRICQVNSLSRRSVLRTHNKSRPAV